MGKGLQRKSQMIWGVWGVAVQGGKPSILPGDGMLRGTFFLFFFKR